MAAELGMLSANRGGKSRGDQASKTKNAAEGKGGVLFDRDM
jgi:hypothetical protein